MAIVCRDGRRDWASGAARYVVIIKGIPVPRVVYAEYPGAIVTAIQAVGVPYAVASE